MYQINVFKESDPQLYFLPWVKKYTEREGRQDDSTASREELDRAVRHQSIHGLWLL